MNYYSTRDTEKRFPQSAAEAIKRGIAPDGGLYMPETIPALSADDLKALCTMDYVHRAAWIIGRFLTDFTEEELLNAASSAYTDEKFPGGAVDIAALGDTHRVLELWHGPTSAFKDMALQIMPHLLSLSLKKTGETRTAFILVATSGDTGKAALEGYRDVDGIKIAVFYPEDGVSTIQKLQMASTAGNNVYVCAIKGNFDDAQTGVKQIFSDKDEAEKLNARGVFLSSANSINWGRLVPQIVYYISAYCDLVNEKDIAMGEVIDITVPTGNFGNILAAYIAKKMGLPFGRLLCASNTNNILTDFLTTGVYDRNRAFYTTMSPSMDILISSNLERLLYLVAGSEKCCGYMKALSENGRYAVEPEILDAIRADFDADYCDEDNTMKTVKTVFDTYSYLIDTHTACALYASGRAEERNRAVDVSRRILTASTASPYKFASDVLVSLGCEKKTGFEALETLNAVTGAPIPSPLARLKTASVRFTDSTERTKEAMTAVAERFVFGE